MVGISHIHVQMSPEEQLRNKTNHTTRVLAQENKASKTLAVKTCGACGGGRNSQSHRRVGWRGSWDPRIYTSPPTQESAPERAQSACENGGK